MKARVALVLIVVLFVVSPLVAWLVYTGVIDVGFEPGTGKNRGELIHPARPLEEINLVEVAGKPVSKDHFLGLWSMVEIAPATCIEDCMKNVYKMRQIRLALGKDAHRVQRVIIARDHTQLERVMADNPGTLLYLTTAGSESLLQQFPGYSVGDISSIAQRIYIIDPLGNLMMRYPTNVDPSDVLKDLRQLLKATWIRPQN